MLRLVRPAISGTHFIRVQLAARAHPQMIIRLGVTSQAGTGTGSIRRPVGEILLAGILHGPDRRRQRLEPA
jgi:hypothetical protein